MKRLTLCKCFLCWSLLFVLPSSAWSTDTLRVTRSQADSIFFASNVALLAAELEVEAGKALEVQARLYPNPSIQVDGNLFHPGERRVFDLGTGGQKSAQIEQLILLGGKRQADLALAKTQTALAELALEDLLRQLRYRLHIELIQIVQIQALIEKYTNQLTLLDSMILSFEEQVARGNYPLKDLVRLKAVYLNLNNDRSELLQAFFESQAHVQTLLYTPSLVEFVFEDGDLAEYIQVESLDSLQSIALFSHPAILMARKSRQLASDYFLVQRKMAVPDLFVALSYDQRGGAFNNQINLGAGVSVPVWNRNQGRIQEAQVRIRQTELDQQGVEREVLSQLQSHYLFYQQTVREFERASALYNEDFEQTLEGMTTNFQLGNISLLEFVDFFESYYLALAEMARIKTQVVTSAELLNLSVGRDIY